MKKIYIVSTPYHLLISIIKTILEKRVGIDEIIIYNFHISQDTIKRTSSIFAKVYSCSFFDVLAELIRLKIRISHIPFLSNSVKGKFSENFFQSKKIFIYNDDSYFGCFFNVLKMNYGLIEDGLNCFLYDTSDLKLHSKLYDYLGFSWECFGRSQYTTSVEVNDVSKICINHLNVVEVPRKQLFECLRDEDIDTIANIFDYHPLNIPHDKECSLLLTQPLSEDDVVSHQKKIEIYKYLVQKYALGTLYIKAHPREKEDYSKIFPNAVVIKNNKTPIEVFLLKEKLHFKRVISTFTTAMDAIFCADEKIQMGYEWTLNFNEKNVD